MDGLGGEVIMTAVSSHTRLSSWSVCIKQVPGDSSSLCLLANITISTTTHGPQTANMQCPNQVTST
jgi:hypothetical protein